MINKKQHIPSIGIQNFLSNIEKDLTSFSKECELNVDSKFSQEKEEISKNGCAEIFSQQKTELDNPSKTKNLLSTKWLYTRKQTAIIFSVSLVTLWNWRRRNILVPINCGGKVYYTRNSILDILYQNNNLKNK